MEPFATAADVEARWRPLSDAEKLVADTLLGDASRKLRRQLPSVDEQIIDGRLAAEEVTAVVATVVQRVLRNPDGLTQESIGSYSYTLSSGANGELHLTAQDLDDLVPGSDAGAFSIRHPLPPRRHPLEGWQ